MSSSSLVSVSQSRHQIHRCATLSLVYASCILSSSILCCTASVLYFLFEDGYALVSELFTLCSMMSFRGFRHRCSRYKRTPCR